MSGSLGKWMCVVWDMEIIIGRCPGRTVNLSGSIWSMTGECERCYIRKYTVRGDLLYSPFRPELLLELVKLVEFTDRETPPSSLEIASCLLMGFDYPGSVRGLASHLREAGHSAEAVLVLAGKREVTDEF